MYLYQHASAMVIYGYDKENSFADEDFTVTNCFRQDIFKTGFITLLPDLFSMYTDAMEKDKFIHSQSLFDLVSIK
jgi:hypothetical protein